MSKEVKKEEPPQPSAGKGKKEKKHFDEFVIREIMFQKNMTHEEALKHLEKYHQ